MLLVTRGISQTGQSQANPSSTQDATPHSKPGTNAAEANAPAYPRVTIGSDRELEYLGLFSADGRFKPLTKFGRYIETMKTASVPYDPAATKPKPKKTQRPSGARQATVVRDLKPNTHAVEVAKGKSLMADLRDQVVNFVYGPEKIFAAPQDVTTDSRQRVIVTDPDGHAVHVLDAANKSSFSIVGGKGRRMQFPNGVAVDGEDNIYVSDLELGMVLVYDPEGRFLRYIGQFKGENVYEAPAGIAIDRKAGRIYLLDPPRNLLFILDLQGKELGRFGRPFSPDGHFAEREATREGKGKLIDPSAVVIHNDELIVLDAASRLQVFDLDGHFRRQLEFATGEASGLCVDSHGIIYVSKQATNTVEAYNEKGEFLSSFGRTGERLGEFDSPAGLWTDSKDRLYIVDADNLRLQMFQLHATKKSAPAD